MSQIVNIFISIISFIQHAYMYADKINENTCVCVMLKESAGKKYEV